MKISSQNNVGKYTVEKVCCEVNNFTFKEQEVNFAKFKDMKNFNFSNKGDLQF